MTELYYIRGIKGRGEEVIKALEEKGGKNDNELDGEEGYYYINTEGLIVEDSSDNYHIVDLLKFGIEIKLSEPRVQKWDDITVTDGYLPHIDGTAYYRKCQKWRCSYATEQQAKSASAAAMISQIRSRGVEIYGEIVSPDNKAFIIGWKKGHDQFCDEWFPDCVTTDYFSGGLLRFKTEKQAQLFLNNNRKIVEEYTKTF